MENVEFELRILLDSKYLRIACVKDLSDQSKLREFDRTYSAYKKITTFLSELPGSKNIKIPLDPPINNKKTQHKLYYVEVAIGTPLMASAQEAMNKELPSFYGSYLVNDDKGKNKSFKNNNENNEQKETAFKLKNDDNPPTNRNKQEPPQGENEFVVKKDYTDTNDSIKVESFYRCGAGVKEDKEKFTDLISRTKQNTMPNRDYDHQKPDPQKKDKDSETGQSYYLIKDKDQVLILYEITFDYDKDLEEKGNGKCERCKVNPAVMYCLAERAAFCSKCDKYFHNDYFTKRHIMFHYDTPDTRKKLLFCFYHSEQLVEFYCEECNLPLCSACRLSGSHSCPPHSDHKLVKWNEAYDKCKNKVSKLKEDYKDRIDEINSLLEIVIKHKSDYDKMINEIRKKINAEYRNALNQLQEVADKTEQSLNAQIMELKNELEKKKKILRFMTDSKNGEDVKFLNALQKNQKEIVVISKQFKYAEIVLKGSLSVFAREPEVFEKTEVHSLRNNYRNNRDKYIEPKK